MKNTLCVIAVIVLLLLAVTPAARALPPALPSSFYGVVTVNGGNVPDGTPLTAWVEGKPRTTTRTFMSGGQSVYTISVHESPEGSRITWTVGPYTARQVAVWHGGTNQRLNLDARAPVRTTDR